MVGFNGGWLVRLDGLDGWLVEFVGGCDDVCCDVCCDIYIVELGGGGKNGFEWCWRSKPKAVRSGVEWRCGKWRIGKGGGGGEWFFLLCCD